MDNNEQLKLDLKRLREQILELDRQLKHCREKEASLVRKIKPKVERCQACLGTGQQKVRDPGSGYDVYTQCHGCEGTGKWKEPV